MKKLTPKTIRAFREEQKAALYDNTKIRITIGMGSCGIAAGAEEALETFREEVANNDIKDVVIKQTGCIGLCYAEPTVEVQVPGMPTVVYGKVTADAARRIIDKHVIRKRLVNDLIFDNPTECAITL